MTFDDGVSGDGLRILSGEPIGWRYTVTNVGSGRLSQRHRDRRSVAGVTPAYVSGDTNGNGYLQPTETWVFEAAGTAVFGNYANTGTVTAVSNDSAGHFRTTTASDSSSYTGVDPKLVIDKVTVDGATSGDGLAVRVRRADHVALHGHQGATAGADRQHRRDRLGSDASCRCRCSALTASTTSATRTTAAIIEHERGLGLRGARYRARRRLRQHRHRDRHHHRRRRSHP